MIDALAYLCGWYLWGLAWCLRWPEVAVRWAVRAEEREPVVAAAMGMVGFLLVHWPRRS